MTNTPEKETKSRFQPYDQDVSLLIRWLKSLREAMKRPANITFAALLIGIGATCIIGPASAFWEVLLKAAIGSVTAEKPESDMVKTVRIVIGFAIICLGVLVLFRKKGAAAPARVQDPPKDAEDTPGEISGRPPSKALEPRPGAGSLAAINPELPLYIEIPKSDGSFTGTIHQGNPDKAYPLPSLKLEKQVQPIHGKTWTLAQLMEAILRFKRDDLAAFDERVQLDVGQHLYDQTLGRLPNRDQSALKKGIEPSIRILTDDEWIAGLPWALLTDGGVFRATTGWSIAVCQRQAEGDIELPPSPRMLVVAPEPPALKRPTRSEDHLEELEDLLSSSDRRLSRGGNLDVAKTWEDFLRLVDDVQPQIIYYYGHGVGDQRVTRLVFETGPDRTPIEKPVADFALCLRRIKRPPLLAYINCCLGDAGGYLGAGFQLCDFIPAVITNRTVAEVPIAQAQAMTLWKHILLQAIPPHTAVVNLYAEMDLNLLTTRDYRWITPVLHAHYRQWKAEAPKRRDRITQDPHWHLKIDRVNQYNAVVAQTLLMLRERKPKSIVFVWYGQEGQGVETFHERLLVELQEELKSIYVHQVCPRWPEHFPENYHDAFSDILTEALKVNTVEDIPARLRNESHGRPTLLYVRHEPVRSRQLINPQSLKWYVRWWDQKLAPLLEKKQFALLTVSFLVSNPQAFLEYMEEEKIEEMNAQKTVFWLLDEMEKIAKRELLLFLQTHNIDLLADSRDKILEKILKKTGGNYDQTVEQLRNIWREVYSVPDESTTETKKTFDY